MLPRCEISIFNLQYSSSSFPFARLCPLPFYVSRTLTYQSVSRVSNDLTSTFRYPPLKLGRKTSAQPTIRLLELFPGRSIDPVQCQLKPVSLLDSPSYEALSYCWGDPRGQRAITCNNERLNVPRNLEEALRGLRLSDRKRTLWADAVCINQSDTAEKDNQVRLMRTVYAQASRTLIWLGELNDRHEKGISVFASLSVKIGLVGCRWLNRAHNIPSITIRDTRTGVSRTLPPFSNEIYLSLIRMLRRPWFQRAWVVQEVVVSNKPTILWNFVEYDWGELIRALQNMCAVKFPLAFIFSLQHIAAIESERRRYKSSNIELLGLLLRQQRCSAADPRDKVFSFCGLVTTSPTRRGVRISYREDTVSIYRRVAVKALRDTETLDLLSRPPLLTALKLPGLPSWVPDWSICASSSMASTFGIGPRSLAATEARFGPKTRPKFAAAGSSRYVPDYSSSLHELIVEGYVFDTITEVGQVFEGVELPNAITTLISIGKSWTQTLRTFLKARMVIITWQEMIRTHSSTILPPDQALDDIFWQTVCAGELFKSTKVASAAEFWKRATRNSGFRVQDIPSFLHPIGFAYCFFLLIWHLTSNKPFLEYELQGRFILNRKMIRTAQGYIGLASGTAKVGDLLSICKGSSVPLALRQFENSGRWELVGDAYVHGIMQGELFEDSKCRKIIII
ncbi:HET-domain-containing protein [Cenococcum geophilum 1.58]|uniref:HET-domain-containing protein n=1 Tax=Cenococcum geophilum 1.58 TaxID=794803 RepID=UPI00358F1D72|nr:HET-domain-containing protein [Cenococcum geophilum 1.58]